MDIPLPLPADLKVKTIMNYVSPTDPLPGKFTMINICDLLPVVIPGYWDLDWNHPDRDYATSRAKTEAWCKAHGAHYYSRDRENFSQSEAVAEATKLGLDRVVYEDLS